MNFRCWTAAALVAALAGAYGSAAAGVTVTKAVRYGERRADLPEGAPDDRLMDIFLPSTPAPTNGYPCVVWIHGGSFSHGSRSTGPYRKDLLERGVAVVALEYYLDRKHNPTPKSRQRAQGEASLEPTGPYPASIRKAVGVASEEAEMAFAYLANHAAEYKLDVSRFGVGGSSAGAITSLELAYARRKPTGVTLRVVIDACGSVEGIDKIEKPAPVLVTTHGAEDRTVGVGYARALKARLDEIGVENHVYILPGFGHKHTEGAIKHKNEIVGHICRALGV